MIRKGCVVDNQITAWSYSRLQVYKQCPLKAKFKFIDKLPEPGSAAMDRGAEIHKEAENYVKGLTLVKKFPASLKLFRNEFEVLRGEKSAIAEREWAFNVKWEPTSWFGKDAWLRVKLDLSYVRDVTAFVVDYKTGKGNPDLQKSQLELYALGAFITLPDIKNVVSEFWYLDQGVTVKEEFQRSQLAALKKKWLADVKPMLKDKSFAPRPNDKCRWCHYGKEGSKLCDY